MSSPPSASLKRRLAAGCLAMMAALAWAGGTSMGQDKHRVFAGEGFYTERPEPEQTLTGKVIHRPVSQSPNTRRFAYRLQGDAFDYPLYSTPLTTELIRGLTGQMVTITGKLIDQSAEGGETELWPAVIVKQ